MSWKTNSWSEFQYLSFWIPNLSQINTFFTIFASTYINATKWLASVTPWIPDSSKKSSLVEKNTTSSFVTVFGFMMVRNLVEFQVIWYFRVSKSSHCRFELLRTTVSFYAKVAANIHWLYSGYSTITGRWGDDRHSKDALEVIFM